MNRLAMEVNQLQAIREQEIHYLSLPTVPPNEIVTPANTLDLSNYGYIYDTFTSADSKSGSRIGVLGLAAFATISWRLQLRQSKRKS